MTIEDGIFEVTATAGDAHSGTEDFDDQIVDVRMQDAKRQNRGKDLAGNHLAVRHVSNQCERAKRTLSSSMQEEIDSPFDDTDLSLFEELNMECFSNFKDPVERCSCDGGINKRSVCGVVLVVSFEAAPCRI